MAVGKTRFATLKTITRNIQDAAQRYYLIHGTYTGVSINNLDIKIPTDMECYIWETAGTDQVSCQKEIFGVTIRYYLFRSTGKPRYCFAYSTNKTDKANLLCQKETGRTIDQADCNNSYCSYWF